jgi:hypothetical protein
MNATVGQTMRTAKAFKKCFGAGEAALAFTYLVETDAQGRYRQQKLVEALVFLQGAPPEWVTEHLGIQLAHTATRNLLVAAQHQGPGASDSQRQKASSFKECMSTVLGKFLKSNSSNDNHYNYHYNI